MKAHSWCRVVIPARESFDQAERCIGSVAAAASAARDADLLDRVEVVVIDDGSPRSLSALAERFEDLTVLASGGVGPAAARNLGASLPGAPDLLMFTDSDCTVSTDWICAAAAAASRGAVVMQGVPWLYECKDEWGVHEQRLYQHMFQFSYVASSECRTFDSRNLALSTSIFESIGGFPTDLCFAGAESRQLAERILNRGTPLGWFPEMRVTHRDPRCLLDAARHKFNHGRGRSVLWREPPDLRHVSRRYIGDPIRSGSDPGYVIPVHMAFLLGYLTTSAHDMGWTFADVSNLCRGLDAEATRLGLRICEQLRSSQEVAVRG